MATKFEEMAVVVSQKEIATDIYDLTITLPALSEGKKWYRVADTSFSSPEDITESGMEELLREQRRYVLVSGSSIILMSK